MVAVAEVGDKTQLLSLLLAARYKKPGPIVLGILVATLANHFIAGALGEWIRSLFSAEVLRWIVGGSLLAVAACAVQVPPYLHLRTLGVESRFLAEIPSWFHFLHRSVEHEIGRAHV